MEHDLSRPNPSCRQCHSSKRRCDKRSPSCSLCLRKGLHCSYTRRRKFQAAHHDTQLEAPHCSEDSQMQKTSIGLYFVDSTLFSKWQIELPRVDNWLSEKVREIVRDVETIHKTAASYFRNTHLWLPIISKRRFYQMLHPMSQPGGDLYMLSLCMKLMIAVPDETGLRCYRIARDGIAKATNAGHLSLFIVQASILLVVFELAHGMYPAGYLSIGLCARLATALKCDSSITNQSSFSWDMEERRRIWWAILVLDRFVVLGCPERPVSTPDPPTDSLLPIDDELWDQEKMTIQLPERLDSAVSVNLGRFGRLAQSTRLLGHSIDVLSRSSTDIDTVSYDVGQLRATLMALVRVYDFEGSQRRLEFCAQSAVCYSAVLTLSQWMMTHQSQEELNSNIAAVPDAAEAVNVLKGVIPRLSDCATIERVSPFLIHAFYKAAMIHVDMSSLVARIRCPESFSTFRDILFRLSSRWKVAGLFTDILACLESTASNLSACEV